MRERQQDHMLTDLRVFEADPAWKFGLGIYTHATGTFRGQLFFVQRIERLKLRRGEPNNSKICLHGDTMSILSRTNTRFLRLFFACVLEPYVLPVKLKTP